jgi:phosphoribosyl 1,2-cyclic phosphodiesterase
LISPIRIAIGAFVNTNVAPCSCAFSATFQALAFIAKVNPKKAYLTHISHLFGTHTEIMRELPENIEVAYDGLTFEFETP